MRGISDYCRSFGTWLPVRVFVSGCVGRTAPRTDAPLTRQGRFASLADGRYHSAASRTHSTKTACLSIVRASEGLRPQRRAKMRWRLPAGSWLCQRRPGMMPCFGRPRLDDVGGEAAGWLEAKGTIIPAGTVEW